MPEEDIELPVGQDARIYVTYMISNNKCMVILII